MSINNILLIEPDVVSARLFESKLSQQGFSVSVAANVEVAIRLADDKRPCLIIMELDLSKHNGIEFLFELRSYSDWQDIPLVVLSNIPKANFKGSEKQLELLGVVEYLYKPRTSLEKLSDIAKGYLR
jgi:DNA-binding response OmpR family regulator